MVLPLIAIAPPQAAATFPGTNGQILYERSESFGADIHLINPDGTEQRGLAVGHSYGGFPGGVQASPDGRFITYTSTANDIFIEDIAHPAPASTVRGLGVGVRTEAAWSPDSQQLAFSRSGDISVIDVSGSNERPITTFASVAGQTATAPDWSPDGSTIVFRGVLRVEVTPGVFENRPGIWTVPAAGGSPAILIGSDSTFDYGGPEWSPDGTQVAYHSDASGENQVYVINVSNKSFTQITTNGGVDPVFSPQGDQIVFADRSIFKIPATGGTEEQVRFCGGNFSCGTSDWLIPRTYPPLQSLAIAATLAEPTTTFNVNFSDPDGDTLTYDWSGTTVSCGTFTPNSPAVDQARWTHDEPDCSHGAPSHPGSIRLVISDGTFYVGCEYTTSEAGTGDDCVLLGGPPGECFSGGAICGSNDSEELEGTPNDDIIYAGEGDDTIDGGGGDDLIIGGLGDDTVVGGSGHDVIFGDEDDSEGNRKAAARTIHLPGGDDEIDGGSGNDELFGGGGLDHIIGGIGNDIIAGAEAIDELLGGGGSDELDGGTQNDGLNGGAGKDRLAGGPGRDKMNGGAGKDTCLKGKKERSIVSCEVTVKRNNQREPI